MNGESINTKNTEIKAFKNLFRFGPKSRIEKMQSLGHIYMKNFAYFIDLEQRTQLKGKGDIDETRLFSSNSISIFLEDSDIQIGTAKYARIYDSNLIKKPLFCLTYKNLFEDVVDIKDNKVTSIVRFDEKIESDFKSDDEELYVLIITDGLEFIRRLENKLNKIGLTFTFGSVIYRDTSHLYKVGEEIEFNGPFHKNPCFSHQEEFRIVIETEVEDHLEITIGDISDISVVISYEKIRDGLKVIGDITTIESL